MFWKHGGETGSHGRAHHGHARRLWPVCCQAQASWVPILYAGQTSGGQWTPPSVTLSLPTSIISWALVEKIFSLSFYDTFAEFCWLVWDKMGDFSAEVATWENRSLSHIICQALLLHVQSIFDHVTFKAAPHLQWHSPWWFPPLSQLKLSVAAAFSLLSLAGAHLFITEEVGSERIYANFLLEMKRKHLISSLAIFWNQKLVTILVDRCHPKWAWIIWFVFLANPEWLWTHSVNKRGRSKKLFTLPAFLPVC